MANEKIVYRVHALQRMFERKISIENIRKIVESGDVIEDYSSEMPEPSRLILGYQGSKPVHIVVSENKISNELIIVTVYSPDPTRWKKDHQSRI